MSTSLNLVFCGTPFFAVPTLDRLIEAGFRINLVVTQPDRPKGRGLDPTPSPVKQRAIQQGLPVIQPSTIKNNDEFRARLLGLEPNAIIVVGYGRIVPQWMLDLPALGNINLHASLLPKYRGAAPIQWAIARGEKETGVTTMKIDAGLDTGDILLQQHVSIAPHDTAETLGPKLAAAGAELMVETLRHLETGTLVPRPQDHEQATRAPILRKEDGMIFFSHSATEIVNRMRGFQPWPGSYSRFRGKNLQIKRAAVIPRDLPPAQLHAENDRLIVGCGFGTSLELIEIQMEGKKPVMISDFLRGYRVKPGEKLGS